MGGLVVPTWRSGEFESRRTRQSSSNLRYLICQSDRVMIGRKVHCPGVRRMFHWVRRLAVRPVSLGKHLFAGFLGYYEKAPLLARALLWAFLIWGTGLALLSLVSNYYDFEQVTPVGTADLIIIGLHIP